MLLAVYWRFMAGLKPMAGLSKILSLLGAVADLLRLLVRRKEQSEHEEKIEAVRNDPAEFFNDHFSGVRTDLPADAKHADKASSKQANRK